MLDETSVPLIFFYNKHFPSFYVSSPQMGTSELNSIQFCSDDASIDSLNTSKVVYLCHFFIVRWTAFEIII